jgi:hypothetical protein
VHLRPHIISFLACVAFLVVAPLGAGAQSGARIPPNARPANGGSGWSCNKGFLRSQAKCVPVKQATDAEIRQHLIDQSIAACPGRCPCPYFTDRAGSAGVLIVSARGLAPALGA